MIHPQTGDKIMFWSLHGEFYNQESGNLKKKDDLKSKQLLLLTLLFQFTIFSAQSAHKYHIVLKVSMPKMASRTMKNNFQWMFQYGFQIPKFNSEYRYMLISNCKYSSDVSQNFLWNEKLMYVFMLILYFNRCKT